MKSRSIYLIVITALLLLLCSTVHGQEQKPPSPVIVVGAVQLPARYEVRRPLRLNELIARSGGMTERAGKAIRIYRSVQASGEILTDDWFKQQGGFEAYLIADLARSDERANPYVEAGDLVYVEEAGIVYIAGDVKVPQAIKLMEALTLRQAIAIAGGLLPGADKIFVRRQGSDERRETITLSRKDVASRGNEFALQANDVVCAQGKISIGRGCPFGDVTVERKVNVDSLPLRAVR
ncbi:MAG: SLBB domain-containing protein [Pyrinomonadaceae bacterium]|nr:SLBB domain-containing protein [Pyrinomonadaceae bacterium]